MQSNPILKLTMKQGPHPEQTFELFREVHTLGREAGNDIIINDPQVSRHHARLTLQGGTYSLEDLGSTNGTFVNGRRVTGSVVLSSGDMIGLGDTVVLAVVGAAEAAVTQVSRVPPTAPAMQPVLRQTAPRPEPQSLSPQAPASAQPTPPPAAAPASSRRILVIGCAALALVAVICVMGLVAWSFLDCQSFRNFWQTLPILNAIKIGC
jgi:pSer/pThr/pTyr-binding forkhead associated (FHA) protein